jgi:hypothetical protein
MIAVKECHKLAKKKLLERDKLLKKCIKANEHLADLPLLNWAMNKLFQSARELEFLSEVYCMKESMTAIGCDAVATVILKQLVKTKEGWDLVYQTNPKLLRGYKKP